MTVFTSDGRSDATNGKVATVTEAASGSADVTVNDASELQNWDGWGGAFSEKGWDVLPEGLRSDAIKLLFGADGAHFNWGRIPMGASDYANSRYTVDDPTGADPTPNGESARPAMDPNLGKFSLSRDEASLIPYIKAAQSVRTDLKFWATPWTPPISMKSGYAGDANDSGSTANRPSYFDGGTMAAGSSDANLKAYAQLFVKFVSSYKDKGINIDIVSPQTEPGYQQNYPSCVWDEKVYTDFIGKYLGPAMKDLNVKVMLGPMSNNGDSVRGAARNDTNVADAVLADSTAKSFLAVAGAQWGVLEAVNRGYNFGGLPVWASEHKSGNYPWVTSAQSATSTSPAISAYNSSKAPNDLAYAQESWFYIRRAVAVGKVTAYNAWNMVLDTRGLGIDTTRDWKQNALLVVDGGSLIKTPTYWVFRHASQFTSEGGGKVVSTTAGTGVESLGFKNADGSLVAVIYNTGAAKTNFIVSIGGKKLQFAMPAAGWATVYVPKP
jgi:glucosylceramidase